MFQMVQVPIDVASLRRELVAGEAGACNTFEGWVRNHNEGRKVLRMEYEAYDVMAVKEGDRILDEARERFAITRALCVHRTGLLQIGECSVWIGVSAPHRDASFAACRYIIDEIKHRLPIWKKEHYADGDSGWVNCTHSAEHA